MPKERPPRSLPPGVDAEMVSIVTERILYTERQLAAEACRVPVDIMVGDVRIAWVHDKLTKRWRIMSRKGDGDARPLVEQPVQVRLDVFPDLGEFARRVRGATDQALREAGLLKD